MWPPQYTLKKHPRARHVKLKTSVKHGLEIVVPRNFGQKHIPEILETNRKWIEKKLLEIHNQRLAVLNEPLPTAITLTAINQKWQINYCKTDSDKIKLLNQPQCSIVLYGNVEDVLSCKQSLRDWLKKMAKIHLSEKLQTLSKQTQLDYKHSMIRSQTTRWGSCTSEKVISLNYKLLFLPPHLVNHILIHELCHTVHLNHSENFWNLVALFDDNCAQHRREVRRAETWIPNWLIHP